MRTLLVTVGLALGTGACLPPPVLEIPSASPMLTLPGRPESLRLAAIGDSGTGAAAQYRVAGWMAAAHQAFPFEFVLMMGDNLYGRERPGDYERKFARAYQPLLDAGVDFYASLGNHDETSQRYFEPFNMNGERYYVFEPRDGVRVFAIDSNYLSPEQLEWLDRELAEDAEWKIAFFHHPIYSSGGRHGSNVPMRQVLEPLFVKHGVDVVFQGHDHFYERIEPQQGVHYFVSGAAAKLRRGDIDETGIHAEGFDNGYHFMLVEIAGRELYFQVISDQGQTVDQGVIRQGDS